MSHNKTLDELIEDHAAANTEWQRLRDIASAACEAERAASVRANATGEALTVRVAMMVEEARRRYGVHSGIISQ